MTGLFQKEKIINKVLSLPVEEVFPNPAQPRLQFDESDLQSLCESIKENGVLQPISVRRRKEGGYELIAGERRLRAAKRALFTHIPAVIMETTSRQSAIYAILENIQRKDLNMFEEAMALRSLINEWGVTQEEAAEKLGKAQSTIANKLRLLGLSNVEQGLLVQNHLTERHARALLQVKDEQERLEVLQLIVSNNWNVKQTDQYIEKRLKERKSTAKKVFLIKDVRIFINTINKAIDTMKSAGIEAQAERKQDDRYIEYLVRIPVSRGNCKNSGTY